ncbi:DUF2029 domain-containing protein [Corynebacterium sp. zg254]|uniref:DUF2029 domain-containing protein n=1 Tax=Corynebacterium zhongnanshanii TaxID=2768834 RepID=A0ABQ6VJV3_9CORY|nr:MULTISPECIES: glycosyltransferase family 87 protein [Corynebacterium]KAB3523416.1 DUF2029 domain-containing protein [Corynebacterium zhongnanshanii]MCR5913452.1 DUF2029 domain-containing protein [Corynebacterium sp. zg254]
MSAHALKAPAKRRRVPQRGPLAHGSTLAKIASLALWPLALIAFIHKTFITPFNGPETDDFTTVISALYRFREGIPVYNEQYWQVDPHYLYSPGATLLLSPLAWLPEQDASRMAYIVLNSIAVVCACGLLTKLFDLPLSSPVFPGSVWLLFNTESLQNTLAFSNINGLLLFLEVVFLWGLLRRHPWLGGIALGLAITIKPQFAPLLVLPLFKKQWATFVPAVGIPLSLNLAAWPMMTSPEDFFTKLMPYLAETRDYANNSITGMAAYFGWSEGMTWFWRIFGALVVGTALFLLLQWRHTEELFWATTTTSLILIGVFLLSSLGQMYYTMLALPMFFTILLRRSVMHNPMTWLGMYFCLTLDSWKSEEFEWFGYTMENVRGTIGWALIMLSATTMIVVWTVKEKPWTKPSPSTQVHKPSRQPYPRSYQDEN